ncbi:MAG: DUF86 domain-containing protein [Mariprofundales bacterium]
MNDVVLNKKESIERCISQIRRYYAAASDLPFEQDFMKQDAIAANLQRACEQCIDLANHVIRIKKLGLVKASRESFDILARERIISDAMAAKLGGMVGFRNTLAHQYQALDIALMQQVIEQHLDDLLTFTTIIMHAVDA